MTSGSFTNIKQLNGKGYNTVCIDLSGKNKSHVLTCGTDGTVSKWSSNALLGSAKSESFTVSQQTSGCVVWNDSTIFVAYNDVDFSTGGERELIGRVTNEDFEKISGTAEFQLGVISIDTNETYMFGTAGDFAVKRVKYSGASPDIKLQELEDEPLCIRIDPKNEFVAVSSVDGLISIFTVEPFELVTTIKNAFPVSKSFNIELPLAQIAWSADGSELFVASRGLVRSYGRDAWQSGRHFQADDSPLSPHAFSTCCISLCGKFLASSTMNNLIVVWEISTRKQVSSTQYTRNAPGKTTITSMTFAPFSPSDIILTDANAGICLLQGACNSEVETSFGASSSGTRNEKNQKVKDDMDDDDDDDDDSMVLSRSMIKKKSSMFDDEANEDEGIRDEPMDADENSRLSIASENDIGAIKKRYGFDNIGTSALEEYGFGVAGEVEPVAPTDFSSIAKDSFVRPSIPPPPTVVVAKPNPIPERFVCGSTPSDLSQRYLKWNQHGMVRSYVSKQAKTSSIEINFHDMKVHPEIVIDNFETNYEVADMSLKAVALASFESKKKEKEQVKDNLDLEDGEVEIKGTSELLVILVDSWDNKNRRWGATLPRGDGAVDVLASDTLVSVITSRRNVRIFTVTGTQRQIISHPGPILTATCFRSRIAIAGVTGGEFFEEGRKDSQWRHEVHEYDVNSRSWYRNPVGRNSSGAVQRVDVPVAAGEGLEWIGYTSKGNLVVMDSNYTVYLRTSSGIWTPILEGQSIVRAQSDAVWPIGVIDTAEQRQIRYIYCRGSKYPLVSVSSPPSIIPWKLPYCDPESDKAKNEQELILNELAQCDATVREDFKSLSTLEKQHTASIAKLFTLACKMDRESRAADLVSMITSAKGIQLLCNFATKNKRLALAEKVAEIGRQNVDSNATSSREFYPVRQSGFSSDAAYDSRRQVEEEDDDVIRPASVRVVRKSNAGAAVKDVKRTSRVFSSFDDDEPFGSSSRKDRRVVHSRQQLSGEEDNGYDDDNVEDSVALDIEPDSQASTIEPESMSTVANATILPMDRIGRNPFKRAADTSLLDTSSTSIFDQLEKTPVDIARKRQRDEEEREKQQPARKQAKLGFGSTPKSTVKLQEKKTVERKKTAVETETKKEEEPPVVKSSNRTPYSVWLEDSESSLREKFSTEDGENDFAKFCIQAFRALSKEEKTEWKEKAQAAV